MQRKLWNNPRPGAFTETQRDVGIVGNGLLLATTNRCKAMRDVCVEKLEKTKRAGCMGDISSETGPKTLRDVRWPDGGQGLFTTLNLFFTHKGNIK